MCILTRLVVGPYKNLVVSPCDTFITAYRERRANSQRTLRDALICLCERFKWELWIELGPFTLPYDIFPLFVDDWEFSRAGCWWGSRHWSLVNWDRVRIKHLSLSNRAFMSDTLYSTMNEESNDSANWHLWNSKWNENNWSARKVNTCE